MSKYVLTHQPNLVNLYVLGRLRPSLQPLPLVEAADHHLKAYPEGYRGPTDRYPTSQRPPHGESGSPQIWHLTLTGKWYLALSRYRHLALSRPQALTRCQCWHLSQPHNLALHRCLCWHLSQPHKRHLHLPGLWQRKSIILCLTIRSTWHKSSICERKVRHITM
jgi:hypothetical protein